MQNEIKYVHKNLGLNVVYVTHHQSETPTMPNKIVVFNDGVNSRLRFLMIYITD